MSTSESETPSGLGGQIVAGTGAAAVGLAIGGALGPEAGGVVAAALTPVLERVAQLDHRSWTNVDSVFRRAFDTAGIDAEAFASWSDVSPARLRLLGQVVEAALHAMDDARIDALARVLADTYEDDALLDTAPLVVAALRELDPAHVLVLVTMTGEPQATVEGHATNWSLEHLKLNLPRLAIGMEPVLATLDRVGAVYASGGFGGSTVWEVTDFGRLCLAHLSEASMERVRVEDAP